MTPADMRKNYALAGLAEADAGDCPMALFRRWFEEAAALPEPNAMTLATVSADGFPSARIVLLKLLDDRGFTFFTNYESRKARELSANGRAALVFLWDELERQVRIEGIAVKSTPEESDAYYATRPSDSKLGAWASAQSEPIPDRAWLEREHAALLARYPDGHPPRPPHWGGYRVEPSAVEFWQGRPSRLHDRIRFTRHGNAWVRVRLAP